MIVIEKMPIEALWTFLGNAWGSIGPLVGVVVGALLARSWDKQKWMKDNRKQECRELLSSIMTAASLIISRTLLGDMTVQGDDAYKTSVEVFQTRIFIEKDVRKFQLLDLWAHAVHDFNRDKERSKFDSVVDRIRSKIVEVATK